jgi:hypothetical protein
MESEKNNSSQEIRETIPGVNKLDEVENKTIIFPAFFMFYFTKERNTILEITDMNIVEKSGRMQFHYVFKNKKVSNKIIIILSILIKIIINIVFHDRFFEGTSTDNWLF